MPDFPSQVNVQPAPGIAGDFASTNPRATVLAGAMGLVAGPSGASVGLFGWLQYPDDADGAPAQVNNFGPGVPDGIIAREQQAVITTYLAASGVVIPAGMPVTLFNEGDFFLKNNG